MTRAALVVAVLLLGSRAGAEPAVVVVLDAPGAPPLAEFVDALELHLGAAAVVRRGPHLADGSVAERIAAAARHGEEEAAALVVWIETGPEAEREQLYVAYVVGGRGERALLEVIRVSAEQRTAAARIVALAVGSLVDRLLGAAAAAADVTAGLDVREGGARDAGQGGGLDVREGGARDAGQGGGLDVRDYGRGSGRPGFSAALDARGARGGEGWRGGGGLAGGVAWRLAPWRLDARIAAAWLSGTRARLEAGAVDVGEVGVGAGARLSHAVGAGALGAELELGVRVLRAVGFAHDRRDTALVATPTVSGLWGGGLSLSPALSLWLAGGAEVSLIRRRFLLSGEPAADLGRVRPVARLSLVWALP